MCAKVLQHSCKYLLFHHWSFFRQNKKYLLVSRNFLDFYFRKDKAKGTCKVITLLDAEELCSLLSLPIPLRKYSAIHFSSTVHILHFPACTECKCTHSSIICCT